MMPLWALVLGQHRLLGSYSTSNVSANLSLHKVIGNFFKIAQAGGTRDLFDFRLFSL